MDNQNNFNENMNQENPMPPRRPEGNSRFWHGVLAGALVTVFAGLIVVGMSLGIYLFSRSMGRGGSRPEASQTGPGITDGKEKAGNELDYEQINTKMSLIQNIIDRYFLYDEDMENVEDYIYKGMLAGLDDPYSEYYTAEDYKEMQESTEGVYSGIGAMLSQNRNTGLCTIVRVFENSPAFEAGMKPGDILYKVEDKVVANESLTILVNNYIKDGLVPRAEGKRYGPIHLGYLTAVVALKQVLSVRDIGALMGAGRALEKTPPEQYAYFCDALDHALSDTARAIDPEAGQPDLAKLALDFAVRSYANQLACQRILSILQPRDGKKHQVK